MIDNCMKLWVFRITKPGDVCSVIVAAVKMMEAADVLHKEYPELPEFDGDPLHKHVVCSFGGYTTGDQRIVRTVKREQAA